MSGGRLMATTSLLRSLPVSSPLLSSPQRFINIEKRTSGHKFCRYSGQLDLSGCPMGEGPVRPDVVASVTIWIAFEIILMLGLCLPKRARCGYFGHDFSGPDP